MLARKEKLIKSRNSIKMVTAKPKTAAEEMGLGPKKTALVLVTVVGCIAILFPKILYPMMMGPSAVKDNRQIGENHKNLNLNPNFNSFDALDLLKQERPKHLRDLNLPGMQERGRAIPAHTVPIIERPGLPGGLPPRSGIIERRVSYQFHLISSRKV